MISGTVEEFYSGAWVADIVTSEKTNGTFTLAGTSWQGHVLSEVLSGGRWYSRILGGNGGLSKPLGEKHYRGSVPVLRVFDDILREAGEISGTNDLSSRTTFYERGRGTAGQQLNRLAEVLNAKWWIDRNGSVTLSKARPGGEISEGDVLLLSVEPDGTHIVNVQHAGSVKPGRTFRGMPISHVRWIQDSKRAVAELEIGFLNLPKRDDFYTRQYAAKVDRQQADGSLDLIVSERFMLTAVPLLVGLPSCKVVINPGDIVTVGFLNGDAQRPYAIGMYQSNGSLPVARVSDTVAAGSILIVQAPGFVVAAEYFPSGPVGDLAAEAARLTAVAGGNTAFLLKMSDGQITSGNERILL
jgi:hypothetical protein